MLHYKICHPGSFSGKSFTCITRTSGKRLGQNARVMIMWFEPPHDKTNKMACAQQGLRSAWASAQSDQSSLSAWRNLRSFATHWVHSEDSDQTYFSVLSILSLWFKHIQNFKPFKFFVFSSFVKNFLRKVNKAFKHIIHIDVWDRNVDSVRYNQTLFFSWKLHW